MMQAGRLMWTIAACALMAAFVGCGGSSPSSAKTSASTTSTSSSATTTAPPPAPKVRLTGSSPALSARSSATSPALLPARYTCNGANISLPVRWSGVPASAKELALFVVHLAPRQVARGFTFDWAVAGLKPSIHELAAGKLPTGAIVGRNGEGKDAYSVCPGKHQRYNFGVILFATSQPGSYKPGFDPKTVMISLFHNNVGEGLLASFRSTAAKP